MHAALKSWLPSDRNPWDFDAAAHLMRRAGFGDSPDRVEAMMRIGPENAVIEVVKGPRKDPAIDELEAIYPLIRGSGSVESARKWLLTRMLSGSIDSSPNAFHRKVTSTPPTIAAAAPSRVARRQ